MTKKTRFPLIMRDGAECNSMADLRAHFDIDKVIEYFAEDKLAKWLDDRYESKIANQVAALSKDAPALKIKLYGIFGLDATEDTEFLAARNERLAKLRQLTDDEAILRDVDLVAFDQDELFDRYDEGRETIILCDGEFDIPEAKRGLTYIKLFGAKIAGEPEPKPVAEPLGMRSSYNVGDFVSFGVYWQEYDKYKTPIKWRVVDVQSDKALLISCYGLDCKRYNEHDESVTWETCTLRKWLNGDFLNSAFSVSEQKSILTATLDNMGAESVKVKEATFFSAAEYKIRRYKVADTSDKIFLLSIDEVKRYYSTPGGVIATKYAEQHGVNITSYCNSPWWLRSPGRTANSAAAVGNGCIGSVDVSEVFIAVHPALWVQI